MKRLPWGGGIRGGMRKNEGTAGGILSPMITVFGETGDGIEFGGKRGRTQGKNAGGSPTERGP